MTAIQADLSNYKIIQTRKMLQIILEVPLEHATQVTSSLGWPNPGESVSVAIVRIQPTEGEENAVS